MGTINDIVEFAKKELVEYLDKTGRLLYSSAKTIKKGDIYFMGINPAGGSSDQDEVDEKETLGYDLNNLPNRTINAYIDEKWTRGNKYYEKGQYLLQKRTTWLLNELTGGEAESVCATNLVFIGTETANDIEGEWITKCWKVHECLIKIVRPKIILSCGVGDNTPYCYLKEKYHNGKNEEIVESGHASWKCYAFKANIEGVKVWVVGLPHLSRYNIIGKEKVVDWIKKKMMGGRPCLLN